MAKRTCSIPGCENPQTAKGYCNSHYARWKRHGDPLAGARSPASFPANLLGRLKVNGRCVEFDGPTDAFGYARVRFDGKLHAAHRAMYELMVGPIPEGLVIDHLCRNPPCVNPAHLEPVTQAENIRRGVAASMKRSMTHCKNGHPFDEANTRIRPNRGGRTCRACELQASARYKARKRAERRREAA